MASIRRPGTVSAAALLGLTACLAAAHLLAPDWSRAVGLDVWNYSGLSASRHEAADRRTALEQQAERNTRRRAAADLVAARAARGDVTLAAAADELSDLFADEPGARTALETLYPEFRDPRLLFARHVVDRAVRLPAEPEAQEAVRARLDDAFCALAAGVVPQDR